MILAWFSIMVAKWQLQMSNGLLAECWLLRIRYFFIFYYTFTAVKLAQISLNSQNHTSFLFFKRSKYWNLSKCTIILYCFQSSLPLNSNCNLCDEVLVCVDSKRTALVATDTNVSRRLRMSVCIKIWYEKAGVLVESADLTCVYISARTKPKRTNAHTLSTCNCKFGINSTCAN